MPFDLIVNFPATLRPQETTPLYVDVPAPRRDGSGAPAGTVVTLRPLIPGALVVPAEQALDVGRAGARATFYVTPVGKGRLPEPRVEVYHDGRLAAQLKMRMKAVTQRRTWWLLLSALLLPALLLYFTRYHRLEGLVPARRTKPEVNKKAAEDILKQKGESGGKEGDKPAGKPAVPPPGQPAAGEDGAGSLEDVLFVVAQDQPDGDRKAGADKPGAGDKGQEDKPAGGKPGTKPPSGAGRPPGRPGGGNLPPGVPAPPGTEPDDDGTEEYLRVGSPDEVLTYRTRMLLRDNVPEFPNSPQVFDATAGWLGWFYGLLCGWAHDVRPAFWLMAGLLLLTFASWLSRRRMRLKVRRSVSLNSLS